MTDFDKGKRAAIGLKKQVDSLQATRKKEKRGRRGSSHGWTVSKGDKSG